MPADRPQLLSTQSHINIKQASSKRARANPCTAVPSGLPVGLAPRRARSKLFWEQRPNFDVLAAWRMIQGVCGAMQVMSKFVSADQNKTLKYIQFSVLEADHFNFAVFSLSLSLSFWH